MAAPPKKLLDQVREAIRIKHYSYRTEGSYVLPPIDWRIAMTWRLRHASRTHGAGVAGTSGCENHDDLYQRIFSPRDRESAL